MHIVWHGQSCFYITAARNKGEQVSVVVDPFDEATGLKVPSLTADVLLITHQHHDHNNKKAVKGDYFLVEGPGEYEVKDIFVRGIPAFHDEEQGKKRGQNTVYVIEAEGIRVCHVGDFGQKELTPEQLEQIGDVDVLMTPVGGTYTINSKGSAKIISQLEPAIVIPMHYHLPKLKIKLEPVDRFLKEMGRKTIAPEPKLLIKKKDLPTETKIVLLRP